jgi:hypothetical protein
VPGRDAGIDTLLMRLRQLPAVKAAGFARHGVLIGEALAIGQSLWALASTVA